MTHTLSVPKFERLPQHKLSVFVFFFYMALVKKVKAVRATTTHDVTASSDLWVSLRCLWDRRPASSSTTNDEDSDDVELQTRLKGAHCALEKARSSPTCPGRPTPHGGHEAEASLSLSESWLEEKKDARPVESDTGRTLGSSCRQMSANCRNRPGRQAGGSNTSLLLSSSESSKSSEVHDPDLTSLIDMVTVTCVCVLVKNEALGTSQR